MSFSSKLRAPGAAALLVGAAAAVAACGSGGGGTSAPSAAPSWAKTLGAGVTVTAGNASPGDGSPGGSLLGALAGAEAADFSKFCSYFPPSDQANCNSTYSGVPAASLKTAMPTDKNVVVTYTAIDGDEALVNVTGTICDPNQTPSCISNSDPAAFFDSGKPFTTLWSESVANSSSYTPAPMTKINGKWYLYQGSD
jgi:hypothetical protein